MADTNNTKLPSFEPTWSSQSRVWREYCVTIDINRSIQTEHFEGDHRFLIRRSVQRV